MGLVLNLHVRDASGVFGVRERDTGLSLRALRHPWLAYPDIFGSYMGGHRTLGGTQHTTQNWKSPCRQGEHKSDRGSKEHATARNMQTEKVPADPRMPQPDGTEEAQLSKKKPLLNNDRHTSLRVTHCRAMTSTVQTPTSTATQTPTRTHTDALVLTRRGPAPDRGDRCPGRDGRRMACLGEASAAAHKPAGTEISRKACQLSPSQTPGQRGQAALSVPGRSRASRGSPYPGHDL